MLFNNHYIDKLYGGFLGKIIGVIHGANIEGWTYEKIKASFGTIKDYPVTFKNFCSDDDINGPIFYMRALNDFGYDKEISVDKMAHTMLNYVAERHGFFWWGGYGISTEDTAYQNLVHGIPAPISGSVSQNGKAIAEQIGGQIFSDCWGLLCPDDISLAAELAGKMSSVSHGGNGIYGGQFIAACIAKAYTISHPVSIINEALKVIPEDCEYALMVKDVMEKGLKNKDDWEKTFYFVKEKYGYQNYPGVCHIMPNAAVIILSLVHGKGNFDDTINICNMCGWDTDCNVGNIGTIMGVITGAEAIDTRWTKQINDFICASSVLGCLNIQTVSQVAALAAKITCAMYKVIIPESWEKILSHPEGKYFHFEFPGATHAFRSRYEGNKEIFIENSLEECYQGKRSLCIKAPFIQKGEAFSIYHKTYYRPEDFDDSRYDPDFSPTMYPGDVIHLRIKKKQGVIPVVKVLPYIKNRLTDERIMLEENAKHLSDDTKWTLITFEVPKIPNLLVEEFGLEIIFLGETKDQAMVLFLDEVEILSHPDYSYEFSHFLQEKWNVTHECPAHLTYLRGMVRLYEEQLEISGYGKPAEAYTGDIHWNNYQFNTRFIPTKGEVHRVLFRVQGAMRGYGAGLYKGE